MSPRENIAARCQGESVILSEGKGSEGMREIGKGSESQLRMNATTKPETKVSIVEVSRSQCGTDLPFEPKPQRLRLPRLSVVMAAVCNLPITTALTPTLSNRCEGSGLPLD